MFDYLTQVTQKHLVSFLNICELRSMPHLYDQLTFVIHMQLRELVRVFQCDSSVRFRHLLSAMMLQKCKV